MTQDPHIAAAHFRVWLAQQRAQAAEARRIFESIPASAPTRPAAEKVLRVTEDWLAAWGEYIEALEVELVTP